MKTVFFIILCNLFIQAAYTINTGEKLDFTSGNRGGWSIQDEGSGEITIDYTNDILNVSVVNKTSFHFLQHWVKYFDISQNPYLAFDVKTDSTFNLIINFIDCNGTNYTIADTIRKDTVFTSLYYNLSVLNDTLNTDSIRELQFNFPGGYTGNLLIDNFNMGDPASPYNNAPTVDTVSDQYVYVNNGQQTLFISGISDGDYGYQDISVSAVSSDTAVIPHPDIVFNQGWTFAMVRYTPVPDTLASATITVRLKDDAGCDSVNIDSNKVSFSVFIMDVNHAPVIDSVYEQSTHIELGERFIYLTGIADGDTSLQQITITATSSDTTIIPNPDIDYDNINDSALLYYNPKRTDTNKVTITLKLKDDGGIAGGGVDSIMISFKILVRSMVSVLPSQKPTLIKLFPNPARYYFVAESAGQQQINNLTIFNINGKTVLQLSNIMRSKIIIGTAQMSKGIYIIQIDTSSGIIYRNLIIN